jgi:hypothetical protein
MYVFGEIDNSSTIIESNVVNYTQNLTTSSIGIKSIKIVSGSISESYWNSLNVLFYTSGSPQYLNEHKFGTPSSNISVKKKTGKQFLTKYHGYPSSSIIPIPSQYYGEKITEKSFKLTEVDVTDNSNNNPIIIDDGKGNLYSTNAHHSQSAGALSSSDNYVGNIFYDKGLVVITETGSWSGSVNYSDLGTNYSLKFDSFNSITTYEYSLNLLPQDYNFSTNYTLRSPVSGSGKPLELSSYLLASEFTSSDWQPYITTINLYDRGNYEEPIIQAKLPRPIRKSDKINMRFKIKLDL